MTQDFRSDDDELVVGRAEGSAVTRPAATSPAPPPIVPGQGSGGPMVQVRMVDRGVGAWQIQATLELSAEEGDNLLSRLIQGAPEDRAEDRPL